MKLFITGTDTNVGKTYVSVGILKAFNQEKKRTLGGKPIASGCFQKNGKLYNHDALLLKETASIKLPYKKINPFAFQPAIAPHIAAELEMQPLSVKKLNQKMRGLFVSAADIYLIEGIGGWYVPLNKHETMADFVIGNKFNVILVVGITLGCLNHAILTHRAIQEDGACLLGWIANCIDPEMCFSRENIAALRGLLPSPCLGVVDYRGKAEHLIELSRFKE